MQNIAGGSNGARTQANISVTQSSYIKSVSEVQINALELAAEKLGSEESCSNYATARKGAVN